MSSGASATVRRLGGWPGFYMGVSRGPARPGNDPGETVLSRPRGLLWQAVQVPEKICDGLLPASRFCACAGAAARSLIRSVTVAKMSARLNIAILRMWESVPASDAGPDAAVTFYPIAPRMEGHISETTQV